VPPVSRAEEFVDLAGATIRNVSRGIIGIAILQALLAGICSPEFPQQAYSAF
jgi:predicted PurR-regulated permease PerM